MSQQFIEVFAGCVDDFFLFVLWSIVEIVGCQVVLHHFLINFFLEANDAAHASWESDEGVAYGACD